MHPFFFFLDPLRLINILDDTHCSHFIAQNNILIVMCTSVSSGISSYGYIRVNKLVMKDSAMKLEQSSPQGTGRRNPKHHKIGVTVQDELISQNKVSSAEGTASRILT